MKEFSSEKLHALFVPKHKDRAIARVLQAFRGKKVLLIGESEKAADLGAMLSFYEDGNRIRLKLNHQAVDAAGFEIQHRILRLAHPSK